MDVNQFLRGMGAGLVVGAAIGMSCHSKKHSHPMKKKAHHALKLVSHCVDNLSDAMGV